MQQELVVAGFERDSARRRELREKLRLIQQHGEVVDAMGKPLQLRPTQLRATVKAIHEELDDLDARFRAPLSKLFHVRQQRAALKEGRI